jgi:TPR repeat protein
MTEYGDATLLQRRGLHAQALAAYKDLLKHHANDGDLLGTIGLFYYHGRGTAKNHEEAIQWFSRGASAGSRRAALYAAQAHCQRGEWIKAREYLERSAAEGFSPALYELGCYCAFR